MRPITRFRPCLGAAFLGLAFLAACGRKEDKAEAPTFIQPGIAESRVPTAPPAPTKDEPGLPVVRIEADTLVATGTTGHEATAFGDPGLQYEWFIQGGSFEGNTRGPSVKWTAGAPGEVRLFCQGTNAVGKKSVALAQIQSEALPSIEDFRAAAPVVSAGRGTKLSWSAKEIKLLVLDPGGQDVTAVNGPGFEVKPSETTRYMLTATNAAGASVSKTVDVKVVALPSITGLSAEGAINFGQPLALVGAFKGGKAELAHGGAVLASGETSPLRVQIPALAAGDSFMLTVTNEAGDSVTRTLDFNPPAAGAAVQK